MEKEYLRNFHPGENGHVESMKECWSIYKRRNQSNARKREKHTRIFIVNNIIIDMEI